MKNFIKDFGIGLGSYGKAWRLINEKKMWAYFLLPILLSFVLAVAVFLMRIQLHHFIEGLLKNTIQYEQWWDWAQWITSWLIHISLFVFSWYLYFKFQKYLLFIVLSPVLAYISERTERALSGKDYPFDFVQFGRDIVRGIGLAVRNLFYELTITFLLFLLGLIPVFAPLTIVAVLVVGWYYYGYSLMDYSNERQKLNISQSNENIKNNKGVAIANGMIFEIIFIIPVLGFVVAPIISTVAATIAMHDKQVALNSTSVS